MEAAEFGRRLATLTNEPGIRVLGLSWLSGRVPVCDALRLNRAWCPLCFKAAQAARSPGYLQSAWSLVNYVRCSKHDVPLVDTCPKCGHHFPAKRRWNGRMIDHCVHCDHDLGEDHRIGDDASNRVSEEARWIAGVELDAARLIGELIACATDKGTISPEKQVGLPDIARALASAKARGRVSTPGALARLSGLAKSTVHGYLCDQPSRPSLDALVRIALVTDVSLAGMIEASDWHEDLTGKPPVCLAPAFRKRKYARQDWDQVKSDLQVRLQSSVPAQSVASIAKNMQIDHSHLRHKLGSLTGQIKIKVKLEEQERHEAAVTRAIREISSVGQRLRQDGKRPSARRVSALLGVNRNNDVFKRAWKLTRIRPDRPSPKANPNQLSLEF